MHCGEPPILSWKVAYVARSQKARSQMQEVARQIKDGRRQAPGATRQTSEGRGLASDTQREKYLDLLEFAVVPLRDQLLEIGDPRGDRRRRLRRRAGCRAGGLLPRAQEALVEKSRRVSLGQVALYECLHRKWWGRGSALQVFLWP